MPPWRVGHHSKLLPGDPWGYEIDATLFRSATCRQNEVLPCQHWFRQWIGTLTQPWPRSTVYPKKYARGFCFAVLCCGYTLTDFPISIRLTSLALWQSNDCPSASKATLMNMDKYFMWIHYERVHNHYKAKHNKTVCIFLGIYCTCRGPTMSALIQAMDWYPHTALTQIYVIWRHWATMSYTRDLGFQFPQCTHCT